MFVLKAYNARVVTEWLACCLSELVGQPHGHDLVPMTYVALPLVERNSLWRCVFLSWWRISFVLPLDKLNCGLACCMRCEDLPGEIFRNAGAAASLFAALLHFKGAQTDKEKSAVVIVRRHGITPNRSWARGFC